MLRAMGLLRKRKTFGLTSVLLIIFVGLPLLNTSASGLAGLMFAAVILSGIYTVSDTRWHLVVGGSLLAPALVYSVANALVDLPFAIRIAGGISYCLAVAFLCYAITTRLLRARKVNTDTLSTAVSGYLLLGILWALIFMVLHALDPGSLRGLSYAEGSLPRHLGEYFYFSFVTLSTLGYGDNVPKSDLTRAAAATEAVVGQLYLAITIARLVGLHIAAAPRPAEGEDS
jgi:hypothetical protein